MEEVKRLHRDGSWQLLPDRYSALKTLLVSIRTANPNLSDKHKTTIQDATTQFTGMETQVERFLYVKQNPHPPDITKFNSIISKQIDSLREILIEIQNDIGG
jgi:hypothetical protein